MLKVADEEAKTMLRSFCNAHRDPLLSLREIDCDYIVMDVTDYAQIAYDSPVNHIVIDIDCIRERRAKLLKSPLPQNIREHEMIARAAVRKDEVLRKIITNMQSCNDNVYYQQLREQRNYQIAGLFQETVYDRENPFTILWLPYQLSAAFQEFDRMLREITPNVVRSPGFQRKIRELTSGFRNEPIRQAYLECLESLSYGGIGFERKAARLLHELRKSEES